MRSAFHALHQHFAHPKSKVWAVVRQILGWVSLALYPLACLLLLDYCNFKALLPALTRTAERLMFQWTDHRLHVIFSLLALYGLALILLLILRRAWAVAASLGAVSLICAAVNYLKILLNGMPFLPVDVAMAKNPGEMLSFVSVPLPRLFWIGAVLLLLWTVILALWGLKLPGKWFATVPVGAVLLGLVLVFCWSTDRSERLLHRFDMSLFDNALQTSNYTANGFIGGFTVNLMSMHITTPEGYSQDVLRSILSGAEPAAQTGEDFDVILVLAESFFDLRKLPGTAFSENPLPNYDAILAADNCFSGEIVTIAHGGGTVNTEFRILTGLDPDGLIPAGGVPYNYISGEVPGFVSNYRDAGYRTLGLHLYNLNFYNRKQVYPLLGFEAFHGVDDVVEAGIPFSFTRNYVADVTTEAAIEYYMDQAEADGVPVFLFAITIENHQPYGENPNNTITVTAEGLDEQFLLPLTTYAQGVKDADQMLGALRDYIDARQRPTVLVWFGDHLPSLGDSHRPYVELGYYDGTASGESLLTAFSTPFLVYSNRPLEQGLFTSKSDNRISELYLMECVAASTGFSQSGYMRLLEDQMQVLPVYNRNLAMEDTLTPAQREIISARQLLTYDRMLGKRYSLETP